MIVEGRDATASAEPLAIICGGGSLPCAVAMAARKRGRRVVLFPLRGSADPEWLAEFEHHWVDAGKFGHFRRVATGLGCRDVVFIGSVLRPRVRDLNFDLYTLRMLPRILRGFRSGDNHLLSTIGQIFEDHGFRMIGAHEVAPEILMPSGAMTARQPGEGDRADIAIAMNLLNATGPFDVGQAAVVCDGRVLAIEAAEGTDQMLARLADMRRSGRVRARAGGGVLVKAPKPAQDRRFDLPSIGPGTVEGAKQAQLAGIAVLAGSSVVAEPERLVAEADRAGLFVAGIATGGTAE